MKTLYILILAFSVGMAAMLFMRMYRQLGPVFHQDYTRTGAILMLPALGFLIVVYTPAPIVFAGLMLTGLGWWAERRGISRELGLSLTLLAASIGLMGMPVPSWIPIPAPIIMLAVWGVLWFSTFLSDRLPQPLIACVLDAALVLFPLAIAPFFYPEVKSLALDIGILASAFFGSLFIANERYTAALALRLPLMFLLAYTILRTFIDGAWPFALASIAVLLAVSALGRSGMGGANQGYHVQTF